MRFRKIKEEILQCYDTQLPVYRELEQSIVSLLRERIVAEGLEYNTMTSRVKERQSLSKKIDDKNKYQSLEEITDVVGVRIVANYQDEVDTIAELIRREFTVDWENSVDKKAELAAHEFGYLSQHYVVSLSDKQQRLDQCKPFAGYKVEIQIRTLAQHVWAEIEHDIHYKSKGVVPKEFKRGIYTISALLELVDEKFLSVREGIAAYAKELEQGDEVRPETQINGLSLTKFLQTDEGMQALVEKIFTIPTVQLAGEEKALKHLDMEDYVSRLHYLGVFTIQELTQALDRHRELAFYLADQMLSASDGENHSVGYGIGIFYLCYAIILQRESLPELKAFLTRYDFRGGEETAEVLEEHYYRYQQRQGKD